MSRINLSLIWLLLALPLWAAPSITPGSLSGTMSSGESVSISGSGFGAKSTAAPIKWDNFETDLAAHLGVSDGDYVTEAHGWDLILGYDSNNTYESSYNRTGSNLCWRTYVHTWITNSDECNARVMLDNLNLTDKVFVSMWVRFNWGTAFNGVQVKGPLRITNVYPGGSTIANIVQWYEYKNPRFDVQNCADANFGADNMWPTDTWVQMEVQLKQSTPSTANGSLEVWVSKASGPMVKAYSNTGRVLRTTSYEWDELWFETYIGNAGPAETTIYYDDIYADRTWQRVVLGDSATYTSCTKREIQIPTAWTDTGITFTVNQGSFGAEDTAYLYVVDADGTVSDPYEVTIGEGSSPSTPTITGGFGGSLQ